jgi:predicted acyltransferase
MEQSTTIVKKRIQSIDALRGFDMFWISGGEVLFIALFALTGIPFLSETLSLQFEHSLWDGFTFYDLIFPLFLFITGLTMPFSIGRRLERGDSKKLILKHVLTRTLLLILLGLIYNGLFNFDFVNQRYVGVLQRIALSSFFVSLIYLYSTKLKTLYIWAISILLAYWAIIALVPVPGFSAGDMTKEGNLCGYIDRLLLPGGFCCYPFGDNEGILSSFTPMVNVLAGLISGQWLIKMKDNPSKLLKGLLIAALAVLATGYLWGFGFTINKTMWTSTYALVAIGYSMLLLGLLYWLIDVKGYTKWAFPFVVIGLNPITIYVLQGLFDFTIIANIFIHGFSHYLGTFEQAFILMCTILVKWLLLYFLYKQKIFLKV